MEVLLTKAVSAAVAFFVFTSMFSLGLDLTVRQLTEPLRRGKLLARALIANALLVPLMAVLLTRLFALSEAMTIGVLLYATCMGGEAVPKFVQIAKGNPAFAVALLIILVAGTVVGVPFALSYAFPQAHVDRWTLLLKLVVIVAVPLTTGLIIRARTAHTAQLLSKWAHRLALLLLLTALILVTYVLGDKFLALDGATVVLALVFYTLAFAIGYFMGGRDPTERRTLGLMTFVRGGGVAMVIAGQGLPAMPEVLAIVTMLTAFSLLPLILVAFLFRRTAR